MKSTPSELISTFRKKIAFSSAIILGTALIAIVLLLFLDIPLLSGNISGNAILVVIGFYFYERWIHYKEIFRNKPEDVLRELESFLEKKTNRSSKYRMIRIGLIAAITLTLLFLLIYKPQNEWIPTILIILVAGILLSHLDSWYLMKDQMMAQDIKRSIRENHDINPQ